MNKRIGIVKLYCGKSGRIGYYNSQELGQAKTFYNYGYEPYIFICDNEIKNIKEYEQGKVHIIYCPGKSLGVHGRFDWTILKKHKIDIIQINSDNQLYVNSLVRFCKANKIKYYCYIGTIEGSSSSKIKNFITNILIKRNISTYRKSLCFSKTEYVLKMLKKHNVNSILAPVGLDTSIIGVDKLNEKDIKKELNIPSDKKIILFVGRLEEYKKPLGVIELLNKLDDSFYCVMIGNGSLLSKIKESAIANNLIANILFIEEIENSKIHNYYRISDYYINLNPNEIFGMSILEAMYQECDVVAINAPGPRMIIENEINGYIVDDISSMAKLIIENKHCDKTSIKDRIITRFSWDNTVKSIIKHIE